MCQKTKQPSQWRREDGPQNVSAIDNMSLEKGIATLYNDNMWNCSNFFPDGDERFHDIGVSSLVNEYDLVLILVNDRCDFLDEPCTHYLRHCAVEYRLLDSYPIATEYLSHTSKSLGIGNVVAYKVCACDAHGSSSHLVVIGW